MLREFLAGRFRIPDAWTDARDLRRASDYLHRVNASKFTEESPDFCVIINTVPRPVPYVTISLSSTLRAIENKRTPKRVRVGFLDHARKPSDWLSEWSKSMKEFQLPRSTYLTGLSDTLKKMEVGVSSKHLDEATLPRVDWMERQRVDYALSLAWCAEQITCEACLVLEDDAALASDAIDRIYTDLDYLKKHDPDFGCLRGFKSDFWKGWENEMSDAYLLTAWIFSCGFVFCFRLIRTRNPAYVLWWAYCAVLPWVLSKQALPIVGTSHRRGAHWDPTHTGVSSIAMVYPRASVLSLLEEISKPIALGMHVEIDLWIGQQLSDNRFYESVPNWAEHAGYWSSSPSKRSHVSNRLAGRYRVKSGTFVDHV